MLGTLTAAYGYIGQRGRWSGDSLALRLLLIMLFFGISLMFSSYYEDQM